MVIIAKIDNKNKVKGERMIRIEYDRLVAICYSIGVLLLLKIPNDNELIGKNYSMSIRFRYIRMFIWIIKSQIY